MDSKNGTYIPAVAAATPDDDSGLPGQIRNKQGHKCCGCCCDTRRAVIIVNIVMICFVVLSAILLTASVAIVEEAAEEGADDDEVLEAAQEAEAIPMGVVVTIYIIQIVFLGMGILGAINYNGTYIKFALFSYLLGFVLNLININIGGLLLNGFFAYPHFFFLNEMNNHIMTPENYPNEVHSCCCV